MESVLSHSGMPISDNNYIWKDFFVIVVQVFWKAFSKRVSHNCFSE